MQVLRLFQRIQKEIWIVGRGLQKEYRRNIPIFDYDVCINGDLILCHDKLLILKKLPNEVVPALYWFPRSSNE